MWPQSLSVPGPAFSWRDEQGPGGREESTVASGAEACSVFAGRTLLTKLNAKAYYRHGSALFFCTVNVALSGPCGEEL